jgi:hypothetical protein
MLYTDMLTALTPEDYPCERQDCVRPRLSRAVSREEGRFIRTTQESLPCFQAPAHIPVPRERSSGVPRILQVYLPDRLGRFKKDVKVSFVVVRLRWAENESLKEEWACADGLYSIARRRNMPPRLV